MIALFVLKLSAGITLMWCLMPRREVTDGFFRIQMRVVLGLAVLSTLLLADRGTWEIRQSTVIVEKDARPDLVISTGEDAIDSAAAVWRWLQRIQIGVACIAYVGSVFWTLGRRRPGRICIYLMTTGCCGSLLFHSVQVPTLSVWLQLLSDFSSAAVCGSILTGMLLGHWYLTTPAMSTRPLQWFIAAIVIAACLRLVCSATVLITAGIQIPGTTHGIWLAIRWFGTVFVPLLVAILVWRILRYQNTQSATGVLFAGLILVLMGEMSGALLERDLNIPY
ncbi:MAG: hypothetical protein MK102_15245 [Fuerstiella sp.]|nr:hypothetical protein [Fuerstiella sp.]